MKNRDFIKNEQGSIIIPFALFLPIFLMVMALSLDATKTYVTRSKVIAAQDAAAIAASVVPDRVLIERGLDRVGYAEEYAALNLGTGKYFGADIDISFKEQGGSFIADSKTTMSNLSFAKAGGSNVTQLTAGRKTVVDYEHKSSKSAPILSALIMDGSGSMRGSKLASMQSAVRSFIDITHPGDYTSPDYVAASDSEIAMILYHSGIKRSLDFSKDKKVLLEEVDTYSARGLTCAASALGAAKGYFDSKASNVAYDNHLKQIILMTDGYMCSIASKCNELKADGYEIVGITFGSGASRGPVAACSSSGQVLHAPNEEELKDIFRALAIKNVESRVSF